MKNIILCMFPCILFSDTVNIDDILTEKKQLKLETSITYLNINKKSNESGHITYQTLGGDYINIPTYLGEEKKTIDYIHYRNTLKYGINDKLEVFGTLNMFSNNSSIEHSSSSHHNHHISESSFTSQSDKGFNNMKIGLIYQLKKEDDSPSLMIGGDVDLIERVSFSDNIKKNVNFKGYSFFISSYYTVDPIVFLLKSSYRLNLEKEHASKKIKSGDIFTFSPNIYFSINPYTSLNWGMKYQLKGKDKLDNVNTTDNKSSLSYNFGVSYEINNNSTLSFDTESLDNNNYSSKSANLSLSYKF